MNERERREEYRRDHIEDMMHRQRMAQESLREMVREYVDQTLENGGEPDFDEFVKDYCIRDLTFDEERHVENLMICEIERWRIDTKERGIA